MDVDLRRIGSRIMLLNILRRNFLREKTADCELHHGQLALLEHVIHHAGTTQQEAAAMLRVTPASVAQSVKRLEKAGLLERHADPGNQRRNCLLATGEGRRAAARYRQSFDEVDERTFRGFSGEELVLLTGMLDRMLANYNDNAEAFCAFPFCREETHT